MKFNQRKVAVWHIKRTSKYHQQVDSVSVKRRNKCADILRWPLGKCGLVIRKFSDSRPDSLCRRTLMTQYSTSCTNTTANQ